MVYIVGENNIGAPKLVYYQTLHFPLYRYIGLFSFAPLDKAIAFPLIIIFLQEFCTLVHGFFFQLLFLFLALKGGSEEVKKAIIIAVN